MPVALESLVEAERFDPVEPGQVSVQQNALSANVEDQRLELLVAQCFSHGGGSPFAAITSQRETSRTDDMKLYDLAGAEDDRRFSPYCWRKGFPVWA